MVEMLALEVVALLSSAHAPTLLGPALDASRSDDSAAISFLRDHSPAPRRSTRPGRGLSDLLSLLSIQRI